MIRFLLGLFLGTVLTVEALVLAGAGHGSYAPLVFTASVAALIPFLGLFAGPLLWALYFLVIPNFERPASRVIALSLVLLLHFGAGQWPLPICWRCSAPHSGRAQLVAYCHPMRDHFDITLERKLEISADGAEPGMTGVRRIELITGCERRRRTKGSWITGIEPLP